MALRAGVLGLTLVMHGVGMAASTDRAATRGSANSPGVTTPAFPLKTSANKRYLVDRNDVPFLMVGDAPQALIANLSESKAAAYMENRRRYGINSLWINLLCNWPQVCREDGSTFDGIAPFHTTDDIATPNPAYFDRVDAMLRTAATNGIVVLLDPIETSGWLRVLRANGAAKAFAYGQFLGTRYRSFPNIIWMNGNDFQTWHDQADDALAQAVARGIRSTDPGHIQTAELNYLSSGTLDDPDWAPLVDIDAAYTYLPTYAQVLTEYNRTHFKPVFLIEAAYEFANLPRTDGGSPQNLRKQEYWTMLSGATGQLYGSDITWRLEPGWESKLDTTGIAQLMYMRNLFASRRWYDLVPDQSHRLLTSGYGSVQRRLGDLAVYFATHGNLLLQAFDFVKRHTGWGSVTTNAYAAAAATPDGTQAIIYTPSIRSLEVDMSRLHGPTNAQWFDPTSGKFRRVAGSPFSNNGTQGFIPPGHNSAGDEDWVLVLEQERDDRQP